ncbi:MAG: nitroreductase family protein [Betaproteobacteria bacterium]|jgi:nitroreductase
MTGIIEAIKGRTSANNFDATHQMTHDEIKELVALANETPTSFNMQNFGLIAVVSPQKKAELKAAAFGQPKVADAAVTFVVVGKMKGNETLPALIKPMLDAGAIDQAAFDGWIAKCNGMYAGKPQAQREEAIRSGGLVAMTLMYAAHAKGLVSGAMIGFMPDAVSKVVGLTDDEFPVMLIAIGRPAAGNWPRKVRRAIDEVVKFA